MSAGNTNHRAAVAWQADIRRLTPRGDVDALRGIERFLLQFRPAGPR